MGTFSGKVVLWPGMFHTIQCKLSSEVLFNARSTSCIQSTKLCVPAGTLVQLRSGDVDSGFNCVYLSGITVPSANAVVVKRIATGRCCPNETTTAPNNKAAKKDNFFM